MYATCAAQHFCFVCSLWESYYTVYALHRSVTFQCTTLKRISLYNASKRHHEGKVVLNI